MKVINVKYIPLEEKVWISDHDCLEQGHVLEDVVFDPNTVAWNGSMYDVTSFPERYGKKCKYCDYQEYDEYDEEGDGCED